MQSGPIHCLILCICQRQSNLRQHNEVDIVHSQSPCVGFWSCTKILPHPVAKTEICWQTLAGDRPFPSFSDEDRRQQLFQTASDYLQMPTWSESKRLLEAHPELLHPEVETSLQEIITEQVQEEIRNDIEGFRLLLI